MKIILLRASLISFFLSLAMIIVITLFFAKSIAVGPEGLDSNSLQDSNRKESIVAYGRTIEGKELFYQWLKNPGEAMQVLLPDFIRLMIVTWLAAFISGYMQRKSSLKTMQ